MSKQPWDIPEVETEWEDEWQKWKDREEDNFIFQVMQGREGLNEGLDNGLIAVNTYIHGTHRGRYILIGADSGGISKVLCILQYGKFKTCERV